MSDIKVTLGAVEEDTAPKWRTRRWRSDADRTIGLVIEKPDELTTTQLVDRVMAVKAWAAFVTPTYAVEEHGVNVMIMPGKNLLPFPNHEPDNRLVRLNIKGKETEVTSTALFDSCPVILVRETIGCGECQQRADGCGMTDVVDALREGGDGTRESGMTRQIERELSKATPEGFCWVNPAHTSSDTFAKRYRKIGDVDLTDSSIERKKTEASDRALSAAVTRTFQREQCSKCPAEAMGCDQSKWCGGAYDAEDMLWLTLANISDAVMRRSEWSWADIWALSSFQGEMHENRCRYRFTGFQVNEDGVLCAVVRRETCLTYRPKFLKNVAELAALFKPKRKKDPNPVHEHIQEFKTRMDRKDFDMEPTNHAKVLFTLWAGTTESNNIPRGFAHSAPYRVYGVTVGQSNVEVSYGHSDEWRYVWHKRDRDTLSEYFAFTKLLPVKRNSVRGSRYYQTGKTVYDFSKYHPDVYGKG